MGMILFRVGFIDEPEYSPTFGCLDGVVGLQIRFDFQMPDIGVSTSALTRETHEYSLAMEEVNQSVHFPVQDRITGHTLDRDQESPLKPVRGQLTSNIQ